jgi:cellulose synthase (UDP-forming)
MWRVPVRLRGVRVHLFRWVGLLHLTAGVAYLYWRITEGLTGLGSLLFWGAEAYVWLAAVGFTLSRYAQVPSETLPSPEVLQPAFSQLPRVDVLVIRQRDSLEATRQTVLSALRLDYPWERLFVHIVDRVEDREMAKVAQAIPCEYWPCPSPTTDPLAYLLRSGHLQGEYLLLLQPGHFVEPDFLWQTLPLFYDFPERAPIANSTGFVQAMLRTLGRPQAVHPLQQLLAVGSQGYQAAPLLGSGCLIRRAALEGIPHIDIRRPVQLGCQMHCRGWQSYLARQAHAGGAAELAYLAVPILFLWTGWMPVPAFDRVFFAWFLPYALLGRLSWLLAFPPSRWGAAWQSERQTGSQFFQSIQALVQAMRGVPPYPEQPSQLSLGPQALAIALTLAAMGVGSLRFAGNWDPTWLELLFGLVWAFYNLMILTVRPDDHDFAGFALGSRNPAPAEISDALPNS